ncbi:MAG: hypothetical protein H0X29_00015 [Parachlamydiaceae bacterium]|nr:hypothetical protein [Parachlamydiaceae bacterium]
MKLRTFLGLLLFICTNVFTEEQQLISHAAIGPEIYCVARTKVGGTKQTGVLCGGRLTFERLKRYGWYLGADALYASGTLNGHSSGENKIRSTLSDTNFEGRIGYTLQHKSNCGFSFTPFFGIGYFRETNNFSRPKDIPVHFCNTFSYIPFGFLSHAYLSSHFGIGINFKVRYLLQHKDKVTRDPEFKSLHLHYQENLQYRIELPLTYDQCIYNRLWRFNLVPFYEYRNYGPLANYPFDFIETKFQIYGAYLQLVFLF